MISIFIASRKSENANSNLIRLLQDIEEKTNKLNKVEVLIRIDEDDKNYAEPILEFAKSLSYRIEILVGKRLNGYTNLHIFYSELIPLADPNSKIYMCFADDFTLEKKWDLFVHKILQNYLLPEYFIVHQKPHPPTNRPFANIFKFHLLPREDEFENLPGVDEAPGWSSKLIKATQGFGPVAATDSWTISLEERLQTKKMNITYFTRKPIIARSLNADIDSPKAERWETQRKFIFNEMNSKSYNYLVSNSVEVISSNINSSFFQKSISSLRFYVHLKVIEFFKQKCLIRNLKYLKYVFAESTGSVHPNVILELKNQNIITYQNYFYLVSQSLGPIDFNEQETIKKLIRSKFLFALFLKLLTVQLSAK